jgi:hypothetical protein
MQQKVIFHGRCFEFNIKNLVPDKNALGSVGNRSAYQPFPGGQDLGFIEFIFQVVRIQQIANRVPDGQKFLF